MEHWAFVNGILDEKGRVRRTTEDRARFLRRAAQVREADDNALDACCMQDLQTVDTPRVIPITRQECLDLGGTAAGTRKPARRRRA